MSLKASVFKDEYLHLNPEQKRAVDTTEGPVMVIAGPGTGKTQVLAIRIAHILEKTDTPANGVLCLTFTNAGVTAMRKRLMDLIGATAQDVPVVTFHSFIISLIEKNFTLLGFTETPKILGIQEAVVLIDELLQNQSWEYLRPRGDSARYFSDLRSLISLLKRERITPQEFLKQIDQEIKVLESDPESISSRGETKGQIKKVIQMKIDGLLRTKEVVIFYELYEQTKKEKGFLDYDDVLEAGVLLVQESEDIRATLRENYLYVLVDEHQDSSGVQNLFLETVWKDTEKPNIFVVGDDRQLIYGFSGANISYFENFKTLFGRAELITLYQNYRSTKSILSVADSLLQSHISKEILQTQKENDHPVLFLEYQFPRDEVIASALYFKEKIMEGSLPSDCAVLVPKNKDVRIIERIFKDFGLKTESTIGENIFENKDARSFLRVLEIVSNPYNTEVLAQSLFDTTSLIPALSAHEFLFKMKKNNLSLEALATYKNTDGLFDSVDPIVVWGTKLKKWISDSTHYDVYGLIQHIGNDLLLSATTNHEELTMRAEIIRSFLHVALLRQENNKEDAIKDFLAYIARLEDYGQSITMAPLLKEKGISVLTLHGSKGLEFPYVRILHMNEETFMSSKRSPFSLPENLKEKIEEKDESVAKRELYVALTRAKEECAISYAQTGFRGNTLSRAHILDGLAMEYIQEKSVDETKEIFIDSRIFTTENTEEQKMTKERLVSLVQKTYTDINVSVSLLNNFFECPWRWYFRNMLKLPEEESESLVLGSLVHKGINMILSSEKIYTKKDIEEFVKGTLAQSVHKKLEEDAVVILMNWIAGYRSLVHEKYKTERPISYTHQKEFLHLKFYGQIDLTELHVNDEVVVTDFKTGNEKTRSEIEKIDEEGRLSGFLRQLAMYTFLIEGVEKNTKVVESKLLFLEAENTSKNKIYTTRITQETLNLLMRDIAEYDQLLKEGSWVNRPCHFKSWGGKQTECEYCKRAKEIYGV